MNIINELENISGVISYDQSFNMAMKCSQLLESSELGEVKFGREVIIWVLNRYEDLPSETKPIWNDLIESAGFYPYINNMSKESDLSNESLAYKTRIASFESDYLDKSLHVEQKVISKRLFSGKNLVVSAPTSFGKSLLIEEIVASRKYKNIVIIQPTLALLDETRIKLKKYSDFYKIIVRTAQTVSDTDKGNLFLLTAERVMEYGELPEIDFLIIDEFYKLSLRRADDRADVLNNAFLKVFNMGRPQFYLLGPNIGGITPGFEERYNAEFYKTDFSMVANKKIDFSNIYDDSLSQKKLDSEKLPDLFVLLDSLQDEQTIIYCASPSRARKLSREYLLHVKSMDAIPCDSVEEKLPLCEWIENNVSSDWSLKEALVYGIAIHDGSLQKHISNSIINYFNNKRLHYIFCTSTIIEGVNTSAKNVVIYDGKKGPNDIDYFDYSNICGRSGRMMEHYIGNVYSFVRQPEKKEFIVDFPFVEQDKDVLTDEILINIEKKDVKVQVKDRYEVLNSYPDDLKKILKINGTNINGQMAIYYALEKDIDNKRELITWSQMPSFDAMVYVLSLAEHNIFEFDKHGVMSVRHLVMLLNTYRNKKTIMALVNNKKKHMLQQRKKAPTEEQLMAINDNAIETAFHVHRQWFQFKVPKAFRVVDSLQRYVCEKHGIKPGSYSYFVQQLENDFVPEGLSILTEYGIPNTTIIKMAEIIPRDMSEDDIIEYIKKNRAEVYSILSLYEIERLAEEL